MSGNRRRSPATADEVKRLVADTTKRLRQIEDGYRWLVSSGYTKPHRSGGQQVGDPADLMSGTPARVRHFLTRAAESLDDAYEAAAQAHYWLARIGTLIDEQASAGGIDDELPAASRSEVRRAEQAQHQRNARARLSGDYDEVTG